MACNETTPRPDAEDEEFAHPSEADGDDGDEHEEDDQTGATDSG